MPMRRAPHRSASSAACWPTFSLVRYRPGKSTMLFQFHSGLFIVIVLCCALNDVGKFCTSCRHLTNSGR
jgi:hypothetical protein